MFRMGIISPKRIHKAEIRYFQRYSVPLRVNGTLLHMTWISHLLISQSFTIETEYLGNVLLLMF